MIIANMSFHCSLSFFYFVVLVPLINLHKKKKTNESAVPTWQIFLFPRRKKRKKKFQGCEQNELKICETLNVQEYISGEKQANRLAYKTLISATNIKRICFR